ncbi:MAG: cupin domain-containing protein [Microbacteriaceae bacterium]|nr:cupin domain-containing protein [Microbacteriaceae bacterium]
MAFDEVVHGAFEDFEPVDASRGRFTRAAAQGAFEYRKRVVVPAAGNQLQIAFMEIPPGKSAYPYHWHEGVTESYVILSGSGLVRTPGGEFAVGSGDVVAFPPGPAGAHRMTNTGAEPLRYVDIDSTSDPDVFHYPDSGKTGTISRFDAGLTFDAARTGYYEGEPDADLRESPPSS